MSLLLRAKGFEKAPMFNEILTKFDEAGSQKEEEEQDDQEIINKTLKLFEK